MIKQNKQGMFLLAFLTLTLFLQSSLVLAVPFTKPTITHSNLTSGTADEGQFRISGEFLSSLYKPSDKNWSIYPLRSNFSDTFQNFASLERSAIAPRVSGVNGVRAVKFESDDSSWLRTSVQHIHNIDLKGFMSSAGNRDYYFYLKFYFPELPLSPVSILSAGSDDKKVNLSYFPDAGSGASLSYTHGKDINAASINQLVVQPGQWYGVEIKRVDGTVYLSIQDAQGGKRSISKAVPDFMPNDNDGIYFGKGKIFGEETYFDGFMRDIILRLIPLPSANPPSFG